MKSPNEAPEEPKALIADKSIIAYLFDAANIATLAGLLSSLVKGEFAATGVALVLAFFFDGIDGIIAKRTPGRTDADRAFGANMDSLVDMAGAGVTLAVVLLAYGGFSAAYVPGALALGAAAALRLSYFNVYGLAPGTTSYIGLPTDQAIVLVAAVMLLDGPLSRGPFQITLYVSAMAIVALMVSPLRIPKLVGAPYLLFNALAFGVAAAHAWRLIN
jgi:CDP-diacylglycerol--serine O-phosphatidyltransferase